MKRIMTWQKEEWPFRLPEVPIDPLRTALLIIDMSNHFSEDVVRVLPNNIKLLNFFRENGLLVAFVVVGPLLPDGRDVNSQRRLIWRNATDRGRALIRCRKGTFDYEVLGALKPLPAEPVIDKNTQGAFNSAPIDHYLRAMAVQTLIVTGVATSHCVESTARDAADRGYNVILVDDACEDRDKSKHRAAMHTFARLFGAVKSTEEVIADLSRLLVEEHNSGWC